MLYARYLQTGDAPMAGNANSKAIITLYYN
jgi:type 1 fimbria pilin